MIHEIKDVELTGDLVQSDEVLRDYRLAYLSRQMSLIGRREALSGKAKFGIFGDGKEVAQIAMAKACQPGDFRSGYYRDQTLMLALGLVTVHEFFAQLYADAENDPNSGGRQMNAHFASRLLYEDGTWKRQVESFNTAADLSPTAAQMPRLVGLAYASRLYRELDELKQLTSFSNNGNEVAFGTIGNASCAEGVFWESINAVGVLKGPLVLSVWDDGYGISVPNEFQVLKSSISELLAGFQREPGTNEGYDIYVARAWDYPALIETYRQATTTAREEHVPAFIHVIEATQPQGHSTSGSQERYKPAGRLEWERAHDCLPRFRRWIVEHGLATVADLDRLEKQARSEVEQARIEAWAAYIDPIHQEQRTFFAILDDLCTSSPFSDELARIRRRLSRAQVPYRRNTLVAIRDALLLVREDKSSCRQRLVTLKRRLEREGQTRYSTHLHDESARSALKVSPQEPTYDADAPLVNGFELLNKAFDAMLARDARIIAFGEDVGLLGDVNQGFAGLQAKYGPLRVTDTGIRETTIIGQAIGLALRGLRPIAEIQYLDYLVYALQTIADDLATLHWRTRGGQKAPVIIRTRGHRLEGIWHSGSPMAGIINLVRGLYVAVPRNMTQAAGFYNTLLLGEEPGLVVEVLNGYRLKERLPGNIETMAVPLGVPEILRPGDDVTLVTYGALCRIALASAELLSKVGIDVEVIDVQTLLPFDLQGIIVESLKKTGRVVFVDEDVPGGATAYMMREVLERQGGFWHLDSEPRTLTAQAHRPAYGSDGDYWSKPNAEQIFELIYDVMNEVDPGRFPIYYR
jgi:pyruvate/2-oxoglutarate/acetoin dehydrogenase E1 component/TPP-dependent pyruvate/acetoin dehydrogenase alpha subunit